MQATYELNRVAPLVKYPPVLTLPLGKIHPFAIYHFTFQQPLNKTYNFKTIFRFGHKLFSYTGAISEAGQLSFSKFEFVKFVKVGGVAPLISGYI
jgi:hypothetical protein